MQLSAIRFMYASYMWNAVSLSGGSVLARTYVQLSCHMLAATPPFQSESSTLVFPNIVIDEGPITSLQCSPDASEHEGRWHYAQYNSRLPVDSLSKAMGVYACRVV